MWFFSTDHQKWGFRLDGEGTVDAAARLDVQGGWDEQGPVTESFRDSAPKISGLAPRIAAEREHIGQVAAESDRKAAQRARCAAILNCPEAALSPNLAQHLALETDMPAEAAIAALKVDAAGRRPPEPTFAELMATVPNPQISDWTESGYGNRDDEPAAKQSKIDAAWAATMEKVNAAFGWGKK